MARPKGLGHSPETKEKISRGNRGQKRTPEQRLVNSLTHKGQVAWNKGLTKETDSRVMRYSILNRGLKPTPSMIQKMTDFWASDRSLEVRKQSSERMRGSNNAFFRIKDLSRWRENLSHVSRPHTDECKNRMSQIVKSRYSDKTKHPCYGKPLSKEAKAKIGNANRGRTRSEDARRRGAESLKRFWAELPDLDKHNKVRNMMLALGSRRPTSIEKKIDNLLSILCPNEYRYVGDGKLLIGGKSPDFANCNGKKKLIEVFGNYWHSQNRTGRTKEEEESYRKNLFSKHGFDTLVVWEDETKEEIPLISKILSFVGGVSEKSSS